MSGRETRDSRCNFFLVGAPKAGTTSIDLLLRGHPDVYLSPIKEPCHFCPDVAAQLAPSFRTKRQLDLARYLAAPVRPPVGLAWVTSPGDYARLFDGVDGQAVVGECSTFYLSSATAAANIHAYNPDARIVAVLRRPIDRIRSHYEMDRAHGVTNRPLLSLVEEELALGDAAHWGNCAYYVGASRYAAQLEAYRRRFPARNIHVVAFESLVADPARTLSALFDFLGIAQPAQPLALPEANARRGVRYPAFNHFLHRTGAKRLGSAALARLLPARMQPAARALYYRRGPRRMPDDVLRGVEALLRECGLDDAHARAVAV